VTRQGIEALLSDRSWYRLLIPPEELAFDSFENVRLWEEIALALLKKYTERYYTFRKREWELPHLEYRHLDGDDPNFLLAREDAGDGHYRIMYDKSREDIAARLNELKELIEKGDLRPWQFGGLEAIWWSQHLYQPLLYLDQQIVEISPVPLNKGERMFVQDLKAFHSSHPDVFKDKELYLLRNLSKGRGVGFFEAGNFHPDFIVWQLTGTGQFVSFVDPKGIRNLALSDPKIQFADTIKEIEERLGDPNVVLSSFIISNTPAFRMTQQWGGISRAEMNNLNILFQDEEKDTYIETMLARARALS
jgi:hypothetical protein